MVVFLSWLNTRVQHFDAWAEVSPGLRRRSWMDCWARWRCGCCGCGGDGAVGWLTMRPPDGPLLQTAPAAPGLRLRVELEGLGRGPVAVVDLQLHAVGGGGSGDVEAASAAHADELVVAVAEGDWHPLFVGAA